MFCGLLANSDIRYFGPGQAENWRRPHAEDGASCEITSCVDVPACTGPGDQDLVRDQASRMVKLITKLITDMTILPPALGTRAAGNAGR